MQKEPKLLYTLSEKPLDILLPLEGDRGVTAPFIRLSESIEGCLYQLPQKIDNQKFYVYSIFTENYYIPTQTEAPNRALTEEVRINFACIPEYLYQISVSPSQQQIFETYNEQPQLLPKWCIKVLPETELHEDTRIVLVNKSKSVGPYKNQMRGKNRFERKKHSQIAKTVKQYNKIDMNKVFKEDILEVSIPVTGETDNYTVNIRLEGVVAEIAKKYMYARIRSLHKEKTDLYTKQWMQDNK